VQAGVYDAFAEKLAGARGRDEGRRRAGDGTDFGPLINAEAVEKVKEHIADATAKGAAVALGGGAARSGRALSSSPPS
jgi:succinate-semialdehyde dehydrogenase/glutarate-semialdehyde dehydrogenase